LFYYIDREIFIHYQGGPTGPSARVGNVCTVWEKEKLCAGTVIDGRRYSFDGNWAEAKNLGYYTFIGHLLCAHWLTPNVFLSQDEINAVYWNEPGFYEDCGMSCYFSLFADLFTYPVPWFKAKFPGVSLIPTLLPPVVSHAASSGAVTLFGVGGQATPARKRKRRII
jgi:hypothetical protein